MDDVITANFQSSDYNSRGYSVFCSLNVYTAHERGLPVEGQLEQLPRGPNSTTWPKIA